MKSQVCEAISNCLLSCIQNPFLLFVRNVSDFLMRESAQECLHVSDTDQILVGLMCIESVRYVLFTILQQCLLPPNHMSKSL